MSRSRDGTRLPPWRCPGSVTHRRHRAPTATLPTHPRPTGLIRRGPGAASGTAPCARDSQAHPLASSLRPHHRSGARPPTLLSTSVPDHRQASAASPPRCRTRKRLHPMVFPEVSHTYVIEPTEARRTDRLPSRPRLPGSSNFDSPTQLRRPSVSQAKAFTPVSSADMVHRRFASSGSTA